MNSTIWTGRVFGSALMAVAVISSVPLIARPEPTFWQKCEKFIREMLDTEHPKTVGPAAKGEHVRLGGAVPETAFVVETSPDPLILPVDCAYDTTIQIVSGLAPDQTLVGQAQAGSDTVLFANALQGPTVLKLKITEHTGAGDIEHETTINVVDSIDVDVSANPGTSADRSTLEYAMRLYFGPRLSTSTGDKNPAPVYNPWALAAYQTLNSLSLHSQDAATRRQASLLMDMIRQGRTPV